MVHTFTTVSTGGFSSYNTSIAAFNKPIVEIIITFFMLVSAINFTLYYHTLRGNYQHLWKNPETRLFLALFAAGTIFMAGDLFYSSGYSPVEALRYSSFQAASILTSTGFSTADFNTWSSFSKTILLTFMIIGGCAGSTAGGIKVVRLLVLLKNSLRQIFKMIHPQAVIPVRLGGEVISDETTNAVSTFFFLYIAVFFTGTILLTMMEVDMISALSAVAATLGNTGPGLGIIGPASTYASLPAAAKVMLSLCMLIGRLEIFTVFVVFHAKFWIR